MTTTPAGAAGTPGAPIRLVASDIDGTLLRHPEPLPRATVDAIRAVLDAGIDFLPVTGRPMRWLDAITDAVPGLGHIVCANGAVVYDLVHDRVETAHTIDADALGGFVDVVRDHIPDARLAFETLHGMYMEKGYVLPAPKRATLVKVGDCSQVHDVVKVLLRTGSSDSDALLAQVRSAFGESLHASHSNPENGLVELAPAGVTKARTLAAYCEERGIPAAEVAAFGDMPNDLEMLQWAGHGYAMADGHPEAIAIARLTAPALGEGGVASVLRAIAREARGAH